MLFSFLRIEQAFGRYPLKQEAASRVATQLFCFCFSVQILFPAHVLDMRHCVVAIALAVYAACCVLAGKRLVAGCRL